MRTVLLLNRSYFPIQIITKNKAIKLLFKRKAEAISDSMEVLNFADINLDNFPKVVRLLDYSGIPVTAKLSKRNILKRDGYRCAYCGNVFSSKELTVDHIIPKSRGGKFSWQNLVTSCVKDNNKKGSRTPDEANMKLLYHPRVPSKMEILKDIVNSNSECFEIWSKFMS